MIIQKEVKTLLFNDYFILALDKKWSQVLGEPLTFEAVIDKTGKLHLISTNSIPGYAQSKHNGIVEKRKSS